MEDVSEFVPQYHWFLKPISGNSNTNYCQAGKASRTEKMSPRKGQRIFFYPQSCEDKPSGKNDRKSCSKEPVLMSTEKESPDEKVDESVPKKRVKQTTIESAFKICTDHPKDPLDSARGRVYLHSLHDIERGTDGQRVLHILE